MTEQEELAALRDQCTRSFHGHGKQTAASLLATIPADTAMDNYGQGGVVADLEAEICRLLGKPAATFLPSGIYGAAGGAAGPCRPPQSPDRDLSSDVPSGAARDQGYQRLHGLIGRPGGRPGPADHPRRPRRDRRAASRFATRAAAAGHRRAAAGVRRPGGSGGLGPGRGAAAHLDGARSGSPRPATDARRPRSRGCSTLCTCPLQGHRRAGRLLRGRA